MRWESEVANEDGTLSFGRWQVPDATGEVLALDKVASAIASPGITCDIPVALLATGLTPPLLLAPTPTPTIVPTPTPLPQPPPALVTTAEQAQLRVWVAVFNCYDHFPELESFTAHEDNPLSWVVEGRSDITQYGLWMVDTLTGEISPADQLAEKAAATCVLPAEAAFPAVVAALQAELLVWAAVYDCFEFDYPKPRTTTFEAYQDNPQRWLVEGRDDVIVEVEVEIVAVDVEGGTTETFVEERQQTVFYGLWLVDTSTGAITPWDALARTTAFNPCYQRP